MTFANNPAAKASRTMFQGSDDDDEEWMKHTLAYVDDKGKSTIGYRGVHDFTLTNEVSYIEPKARVY